MNKLYLNIVKRPFIILFILFALHSCKNQTAVNYYNAGVAKANEKNDVSDSAANEAARRAKYKAALQDFDQAIEVDDKYIAAYHDRAMIRRALGDYNGCIADAEKVAALEPDSIGVLYFIAHTKDVFLKDYPGTIQTYSRIIKLQPKIAHSYYSRGLAEEQIDKYDAALADYNKAIALSTDNDKQKMDYYDARGLLKVNMKDSTGCVDLSKAVALGDTTAQASLDIYCK